MFPHTEILDTVLERARSLVKIEGFSVRKAAEACGIPKTTLHRMLKEGSANKIGRPPKISCIQYDELQKYIFANPEKTPV